MAKKTIIGQDGKEYEVKEKKPFYKKWWFIVLAVIFVIGTIGNMFGDDSKTSAGSSSTQKVDKAAESKEKAAQESREKAAAAKKAEEEAAAKKKAEEEAAAKKKAEEEAAAKKAQQEAERKDPNTYGVIDYITLSRNPDQYIGQKYKFSGKILQVLEGDDSTQYRLAVDGNYDNVLYLEIDKDDLAQRILEDDLVTVYGLSVGTISYKSTLGGKITIPGLLVNIIELNGHED